MVENQVNAPVVASVLADTTITKYYYFNGQRIGMQTRVNGVWVPYDLHNDHLGSTVLTINSNGNVTGNHGCFAYGRDRYGSEVVTDQRFTGHPSALLRNPKRDATGLQSFNAESFNPRLKAEVG